MQREAPISLIPEMHETSRKSPPGDTDTTDDATLPRDDRVRHYRSRIHYLRRLYPDLDERVPEDAPLEEYRRVYETMVYRIREREHSDAIRGLLLVGRLILDAIAAKRAEETSVTTP